VKILEVKSFFSFLPLTLLPALLLCVQCARLEVPFVPVKNHLLAKGPHREVKRRFQAERYYLFGNPFPTDDLILDDGLEEAKANKATNSSIQVVSLKQSSEQFILSLLSFGLYSNYTLQWTALSEEGPDVE